MNLGVQSWCFRNFKDNREVAKMLKEIGLDRIEISGAHFDDNTNFEEIKKIYEEEGVKITSVGVQFLNDKEEKIRKYFENVKIVGAKYMSITFDINTMPYCFKTAEKLSEEYDIYLGIHNHGGRDWLGNSQILEWVFKKTNKRIGLCLDTGWALDSGENPVEMIERFYDRIYLLHFKDFIFDKTGKAKDVVLGEGNLDLDSIMKILKERNFEGEVIIEYEGEPENPLPKIKECVESIKKYL